MRERVVASVREALESDVARIRALLGQLGYDVVPEHVAAVLHLRDAGREVFVGVVPGAGVIALAETVVAAPTLAVARHCELTALVVEDEYRSCGVGAALLERAEAWALERGCRRVRARSNVVRERAHAFYERRGYRRVKAQQVYDKAL